MRESPEFIGNQQLPEVCAVGIGSKSRAWKENADYEVQIQVVDALMGGDNVQRLTQISIPTVRVSIDQDIAKFVGGAVLPVLVVEDPN